MAHAPDATDGDPSSLAKVAKLSDPELDDLARGADAMYHRYALVQKGRARWIEAPEGRLKRVQRAVLDGLLYRLAATEHAHGFVPGRSILTHARLHCGRAFVVTADVRRFFPSVRREQIAEATAGLGLDETDAARFLELVTRRGRLPQGAPTSPHLANLVFAPSDGELDALARSSGWRYSRYADDLAFSGDGDAVALTRKVGRVVRAHGFRLSERKTRVMPRHSRQLVTGLVVNERATVPREERRRLRAAVHRARTLGADSVIPVTEERDGELAGRLAFLRFVDPALGSSLMGELEDALDAGADSSRPPGERAKVTGGPGDPRPTAERS
ncbi:MAG: reverse transcriptase family protein [Planctomycetota bacterium]|jgi:hypothetical protein